MFCVQIDIFRNMVLTHRSFKNRYCFRKKEKQKKQKEFAADDAQKMGQK